MMVEEVRFPDSAVQAAVKKKLSYCCCLAKEQNSMMVVVKKVVWAAMTHLTVMSHLKAMSHLRFQEQEVNLPASPPLLRYVLFFVGEGFLNCGETFSPVILDVATLLPKQKQYPFTMTLIKNLIMQTKPRKLMNT